MERIVVSKKDIQVKTTNLMKDPRFLVEVAEACNNAYYIGQGQVPEHLFKQGII